jgi:photosystem II stability/assembly factor-like uncharacterized protein
MSYDELDGGEMKNGKGPSARRAALAAGASVLGVLAALAVSAPGAAWANGRAPNAGVLVFAPGDANTILVRTTFGLLLSHDGGLNFDWVCESFAGFSSMEDPMLTVTGNKTFLIATFNGIQFAIGDGCMWPMNASLGKRYTVDLTLASDNPYTVYAVTSDYTGTTPAPDRLDQFANQIHVSTDDGGHWSDLGSALDPSLIPKTIEVAPSDPNRIYVSARVGNKGAPIGALLVSKDKGQTWTQKMIPLDDGIEPGAFIAAIDPHDPDRVYVRTRSGSDVEESSSGMDPPGKVLVTDNAGDQWTTRYTGTGEITGFALSDDGGTVYVGTKKDGLLYASTSDFMFHQTQTVPITCLKYQAGKLWVCGLEPRSSFSIGTSTDNGATITTVARLCDLPGPQACVSNCDWATLRTTFNCTGPPPPRKIPNSTGTSSSKCSCRAAGLPTRAGYTLAVALGALGLWGVRTGTRRRRNT